MRLGGGTASGCMRVFERPAPRGARDVTRRGSRTLGDDRGTSALGEAAAVEHPHSHCSRSSRPRSSQRRCCSRDCCPWSRGTARRSSCCHSRCWDSPAARSMRSAHAKARFRNARGSPSEWFAMLHRCCWRRSSPSSRQCRSPPISRRSAHSHSSPWPPRCRSCRLEPWSHGCSPSAKRRCTSRTASISWPPPAARSCRSHSSVRSVHRARSRSSRSSSRSPRCHWAETVSPLRRPRSRSSCSRRRRSRITASSCVTRRERSSRRATT